MRAWLSLAAACLTAAVLVAAPAALGQQGRAPTTVRITDRVLVEDCSRFGINLGGDAYYSGAVLVKKRVRENFEGTSYRQCHFGPVNDEHGATTWFSPPDEWRQILIGGRYTILSGPAKGTTGIIQDIRTRQAEHQGEMKDFAYFVYDKTVEPGPPNTGLLVEAIRLDEGDFRRFETHEHWTTHQNKIETGDVPPGSFGVAALNLDAREKPAHVRFGTHYQRYGETNGTWHFHLWAKAKSGQPTLEVISSREEWGERKAVTPTPNWQKFELTLEVDNVPEPEGPRDNPHLTFVARAAGGEVLIDDVEAWLEGDANPTAFRDDIIAMLRRYSPGCLRYLQMGGNTLRNALMPPMRAHAFTSRRANLVGPYNSHSKSPYSLHQMYELCELIDSEPWYSLPGTLGYEEMEQFMEYLGAPPDTGFGRVRAELGHPQPWTEVFERIHVEFGNEAWNNAGPYQCGGFNGRDYWQDLIEIGKTSPYYRPNVVFHAAGQAANPWLNRGIMGRVPNADRFGVAPYIIQRINEEDMAALDTDEELFRWAFAWPLWRERNEDGAMFQNYELSGQSGIELSVYEVNHHITHGTAPAEPRNRIVTSLGGGLNVANTMLQMLKGGGVRTQALFSLVQHSYNASGIGAVRLWGTALNMRAGHERYRPTFLACMLANRVIGGDLVETVHEGRLPTFAATGVFSGRRGQETLQDLPSLFSYAFRDGERRGLVLVNLDVSEPADVRLDFDGGVAGASAQLWTLTADSIAASNEFEEPVPRVEVAEGELAGFAAGHALAVPAHSMVAVSWVAE